MNVLESTFYACIFFCIKPKTKHFAAKLVVKTIVPVWHLGIWNSFLCTWHLPRSFSTRSSVHSVFSWTRQDYFSRLVFLLVPSSVKHSRCLTSRSTLEARLPTTVVPCAPNRIIQMSQMPFCPLRPQTVWKVQKKAQLLTGSWNTAHLFST